MALSKFYYSSEWETDLSGVVGFHPETMVASLAPRDRMGAIKALVDPLHASGYVTDSLRFLQSVLDREDLESTAVGNGIAFSPCPLRFRCASGYGAGHFSGRRGFSLGDPSGAGSTHLPCVGTRGGAT